MAQTEVGDGQAWKEQDEETERDGAVRSVRSLVLAALSWEPCVRSLVWRL